uniref:Distal membrane-arm assembly complex protein 2 n=1 Tax=Electrophorus electricus TaxID=8005 RepID=A0A4W4G4D0_ELEEL
MNQRFYDVEVFWRWSRWLKSRRVQRKNAYFGFTQKKFGVNIAAAYYVLHLGGSFRFTDQSEWVHANSRGKFSYNFLNTPDSTIEEVDLSRTLINHNGLDNIVSQKTLRSLSVQGCPNVDDWFLARLHVFGESLQELDVSHCPRITVGGLVALQHLRKLRRLDVSSLVGVSSPSLVRILLEEMLPLCEVTGAEYDQGFVQHDSMGQLKEDTWLETRSFPVCIYPAGSEPRLAPSHSGEFLFLQAA